MSEPMVQVNFRMPAGLKDRLEASARDGGRSLTAEIVNRLNGSFEIPALRDELAARRNDLEELREAVTIQRESLDYAKSAMKHAERTFKAQNEMIALNEKLYRTTASFTSEILGYVRQAAAGDSSSLDQFVRALNEKPDMLLQFEEALSMRVHIEELDGPRPPKR